MSRTAAPRITFRASTNTGASPDRVYDVLADLRTHLAWAGSESPNKSFHLLDIDAPARPAIVGDPFSSDGINNNGTFHDHSTVVQADPGARFGFDTESVLDRKHGAALHARFEHRYEIESAGGGTVVRYTCRVFPQNYIPYWLRRGMRPMTRRMVESLMRKNLRGLAATAESKARQRVAS